MWVEPIWGATYRLAGQVVLTANLRNPDDMRILCGTLDNLPQVVAQLDSQPCTAPSRLERKNRDA